MKKIKELIKNNSIIYEYYQHYKRLKLIERIEKMKTLSIEEKKKNIEVLYKQKIGHSISWNNPKTYTEKMQVEKLYNYKEIKTVLSDKYRVREWIKEKIGDKYLVPLLGVWDSFEEIDFDNLPNRFVLKTNHGSGSVLIVKDKSKLNYKKVKRLFDDWMKIDFAYTNGFEMQYSNIERKIIAEEYLETEQRELQDYKFLCFDGNPVFCWVDIGRFSKHTRTVFDLKWNLQPWTQAEYGISKEKIERPKNFDEMINISKKLCKGFSQVRVDLYNIEGKIYFGEMTFTNGSGFDKIIPEKYDIVLGNLWKNMIGEKNETTEFI